MRKMECQRSLTGVIFLIIGFGVIGGKAKKSCLEPDNFRCVDYQQWPDYYCGQRWVRRNCGRMCGTCNIIDESKKTNAVVTVTVEEVTKPIKAGCDVSDSFHCYEYFNEKEYYCGQAWLKENCRYMCGVCGCDEIDNFRCDLYRDAKEHYCRQLWVMQNCKYLCGSCGVIEEVGETLTIEREKRVLKISDNSTSNATSDDAKTEKKLDASNTQETTADDKEDVKVVTKHDDGRKNNNVTVNNLKKKDSKTNSENIIKDEANKKSSKREEQKKKLKSIISAMKGKKKVNSVKDVKSDTMKKDVHLNQKNETKTAMNIQESDKMKKDKTVGYDKIEKGMTKEGNPILDNKDTLKQKYSETKANTVREGKRTSNTNVTIKVDVEMHNGGKEEKKGESSLNSSLAINEEPRKKTDENVADDNKEKRKSETVQHETSQDEKRSKMKMKTQKGKNKTLTDEELRIKDDISVVSQNDNKSEMIKIVKNKITKENQMTINDEKGDKKEDKMITKNNDDEMNKSYQKKMQGENTIARENISQNKTMATKMDKKKETTKNDHSMITKDKKMAILKDANKNEETGTTMKVVDDVAKEMKLIKDTNAKITAEVPSSKQRKDDEKKTSNIDRQDIEDEIKNMTMKGQDIIETGIKEIEEIWITPLKENAEIKDSTNEKEYTRRRNEKVPEEVSPIVKLNQHIVNLQMSETKPNKILWDGEDEKHKGESDCKRLDNFRCFFLQKAKSGLCEISWFQRECKYMCGMCDSKTLDGASYENKLRIPVL